METHTSVDEQFLLKVQKIIDTNLANEDFSVEHLAEQIGLSRSTLHRKLIKLTGKSASEHITLNRLNKAKDLLEHNSANVSETAYKVGFKSPSYFNKVFKKHYHIPPGEIIRTSKSDITHQFALKRKARFTTKKLIIITTIIIILALITGYYQWYFVSPHQKSVAILPLKNLTDDLDNSYLVSGIHGALIRELGQVSSLRIISQKSTLPYGESNIKPKDIAKELNVSHIVEGTIFSSGDSIHLLIQLIDTSQPKEKQVFGKDYSDNLSNILSCQSNIASDIVKSIHVHLTRTERMLLERKRTIKPETYKAFLRGMYHLNMGTKESFISGINFLQKAIDNDPGDPFAYAGIALGYATIGHGQLSSEEAFSRAVVAANKAIMLDPNNDQAYTALALLSLYQDFNWPLAKTTFSNALSVNPNNAIANAHFAWYHILFYNIDEAIEYAHKAAMVEPLSASYAAWLGLIHVQAGNLEQAEYWAHKAMELKENIPYGNYVLGRTNIIKKNYREAIKYHESLPQGLYWNTLRGYCYVKCGQREKALEIWKKTQALSEKQPLNPCYRGMMAAYLGFNDLAFELLNEAADKKLYPISFVHIYPCCENLRTDARFNQLLLKMKLPPLKTQQNTSF